MNFCKKVSMGHGRSFDVPFLTVVLLASLRLTTAQGQEASQSSATRILPFPSHMQVGVVEVFEQNKIAEDATELPKKFPATASKGFRIDE